MVKARKTSTKTKGQASFIDEFIGAQLHKARQFRNLTQEAFAKKMKVSFQQIQKYEKGEDRVSAARLYEAAQILDVELDYFFDGYEGYKQKKKSPASALLSETTEEILPLVRKILAIPNDEKRGIVIESCERIVKIFSRSP